MGINTFNTDLPTAMLHAVNGMTEALKNRKTFLGTLAGQVVEDTNKFINTLDTYNTNEAKRYLDSVDPTMITQYRNTGISDEDMYKALLRNKGFGNGVQMNINDQDLMNKYGNVFKAEGQKRDLDVAKFYDNNANDPNVLGLDSRALAEKAGYYNLGSNALRNVDALREAARGNFLASRALDYNNFMMSNPNATVQDYMNQEAFNGFGATQSEFNALENQRKQDIKPMLDIAIRNEVNNRAKRMNLSPSEIVGDTYEYADIINKVLAENNAQHYYNVGDFANYDVNNQHTLTQMKDVKDRKFNEAFDAIDAYIRDDLSVDNLSYDEAMTDINSKLSGLNITPEQRTAIEQKVKDRIAEDETTKALNESMTTLFSDIQAGNIQSLNEEQALEVLQAYNKSLLKTNQRKGSRSYVDNQFNNMLKNINSNLMQISNLSQNAAIKKINNYQEQIKRNIGDNAVLGTINNVFDSLNSNKLDISSKEEGDAINHTINALKELKTLDADTSKILNNPDHPLHKIYKKAIYLSVKDHKSYITSKDNMVWAIKSNKVNVHQVLAVLNNKTNNDNLIKILSLKAPNTLSLKASE